MQNLTSTIILLSFLLFELFLFNGFYRRREGRRAVYTAWYAWIIDVAAMFSGMAIMFVSLVCLYYPSIFTITVPRYLFYTLFIVGSWQFAIHAVKLVIRNTKVILNKRRMKKEMRNKINLEKFSNIKKFEEEYNKEVEEYYKNLNKK